MEEASDSFVFPGWLWALTFIFVVGFAVALVFLRPTGGRRHRSGRHSAVGGSRHDRSRSSHSRRHRGGRTSSDPFDKY